MKDMTYLVGCVLLALTVAAPAGATDTPADSQRLEQAKDLIADEQWTRAIQVLRAAASDAKERNKDEALFWLAHSLHQARDLGSAVETISELERTFPASRWVKPARSLRVEIAQKLRRDDVLWWTATPRPLPAPVATTPATTRPQGVRPPRPPVATTPPHAVMPVPAPTTPATPRPPVMTAPTPLPPPHAVAPGETPRVPPATTMPPMTMPAMVWIPENWSPDMELRIQALGSLMRTDSARVIPMLKEIALESDNPGEASRAVFVLAQSGRPEAHSSVIEVAMRGAESVRVAAVRELGRFGDPKISDALLRVYGAGSPRVKYQVVNSLGERFETRALLQIAESESNGPLRDTAIVTLGQAGGRQQLHRLYGRVNVASKRPIIAGLFTARAEDELIAIAERETDSAIRREIHARLQMLGTPKAKAYLEKVKVSR